MRLTITNDNLHPIPDDQPQIDVDTDALTITITIPSPTITLDADAAASLATRLQKARILITAIKESKAQEYSYPSPQAISAYTDAKAAGHSDTEAWSAAYNAAPTTYHGIAHADANEAERAYREAERAYRAAQNP